MNRILSLLALECTVALSQLSARADPSVVAPGGAPAVECYQRARGSSLLGEPEARRLCERMNALGPVQCFERAYRDTILSRDESLRLCECASSTAPVECFIEARERTTLGVAEALQLCLNSGDGTDLWLACRRHAPG